MMSNKKKGVTGVPKKSKQKSQDVFETSLEYDWESWFLNIESQFSIFNTYIILGTYSDSVGSIFMLTRYHSGINI